MAKTIKMCDLSRDVAAKLFVLLNPGKVKYGTLGSDFVIITDVEPKDLVYPEGWYYAKGRYTNKRNSSTGMYSTLDMVTSNGQFWEDYANYCTKDM